MSTKEKFLRDLQKVFDKYTMWIYTKNSNGVPSETLNNLPNKLISGFKIEIPNENEYTYITGADIYKIFNHE